MGAILRWDAGSGKTGWVELYILTKSVPFTMRMRERTNCLQIVSSSADGRKRLTDVADTEQLLRIIQSIPSPKAEPFKLWLAQVGWKRMEETIGPEQAIDRALDTYLKKGCSEEWVHQRLLAIRIRNELTDEWNKRAWRRARSSPSLPTTSPGRSSPRAWRKIIR